ncbi:radical SAM protein [Sphingomonas sp. HDW15A]|uniref:MiaB/RimO family radical SAM methylthiotransferase n=1 Tax=Sphingomonas sp. HDW15A TaxID=2714942 RepID=UPI001F0EF6A4|nr:radical SAM protein [Sphingomonas sp. HDW15A]
MSVETIALGCRLNFAEAETMKAGAEPGTIIVNSCAVTNEAVRQTRQAIRRARRDRPEARIVVAGCAVQLDAESFRAMPEVDEIRLRDDHAAVIPATGLLHKVKSFVSVQTGCDHRCTFCAIWQARGPSRSVPYEMVRDAVTKEIGRGAKEIVLTGVDITDYEGGLGHLCQRLLRDLPCLKRLRLSSLDSVEIDGALMELIAGEPRLMPHFHLSLQAGDDLVLKRMKRRHSRAQSVVTVAAIKRARSDATIGADLIAGFPTESEEAALNTLRLLDDCEIVSAHVFPFSPRANTPAARMPQVEREIVKARAARLRAAAEARRSAWLESLIGTRQHFLMESDGLGRANNDAPIRLANGVRGDINVATITGRDGGHLIGTTA